MKFQADKDIIIQRGDVAKYQLTIEHDDYDQQRDPFFVLLHFGMTGETVRIDSSDMPHDEDGNWFLIVETAGKSVGMIKAETHYMVPDSDMADGTREEVEWHWLGFVTESPCPQFASKCECRCDGDEENNHVRFKRVWRGDVNSAFLTLRTSDGEPVADSDGRLLRVRKQEMK